MVDMDVWDWVLLLAGGYIAITTLCQLMRLRRAAVVDALSAQVALERRRAKVQKNEGRDTKERPTSRAA